MKIKYGLWVFLAVLFSCDSPTSSQGNSYSIETVSEDLGEVPQDVYFVFTNPSATSATESSPSLGSSIKSRFLTAPLPDEVEKNEGVISGLPDSFSPDLSKLGQRASSSVRSFGSYVPSNDVVGDADSLFVGNPDFGVDSTSYSDEKYFDIASTCRKVVEDGDVTLNIWVEDEQWGSGSNEITQTMVEAMADQFLDPTGDDIYYWVTEIYGKPWGIGANDFPDELISYDDVADTIEITILLTDIAKDESTSGGVVGYFSSFNNLKSDYSYIDSTEGETIFPYAASNNRLMFVVDSLFFANAEGGSWDPTDSSPQTIFSTLTHEFQHMIHFYQKTVAHANEDGIFYSDTWINEMASEVTEDLTSTLQGVDGPRGVNYSDLTAGNSMNNDGRIPQFNYYNFLSLSKWYSSEGEYKSFSRDTLILSNYSSVFSFGAYLARNFGGAALFKEIVQNQYYDEQAVVQAVASGGYINGETGTPYTFGELLTSWGVSVLLSDQTDLSSETRENVQVNSGGGFTSTLGTTAYVVGSINFFNYYVDVTDYGAYEGPYLWSSAGASSFFSDGVEPATNVFIRGGSGLTGSQTWTLTVPEGMTYTMVLKDS